MSDEPSDIEEAVEDVAEEAVVDGLKKYVRPRIRSIRIPIPRAAPSQSCGPFACQPQSCPPPGPCAPYG